MGRSNAPKNAIIISNPAIKFFIALVVIQLVVTLAMTNAKRLSIAGLLRNVYAGIFFYFFHKTRMNVGLNVFLSLILAHVACFITSMIEVKLTTLPLIDDHVTHHRVFVRRRFKRPSC